MKYLLWRLCYVFWMFALARVDLRTCWYCSGCCAEFWEDTPPREAAEVELSYWAD